jgi:prepilin-type N-terminal cleavage/methylation domain-containing protein
MISLKKTNRGFTIVELLIVIVIIGILAALVITTYSGIQKKARDTERKTDVNALHGQVEAYQAQNGKYPSRAEMNDTTFRSNNLKGLDNAALADPTNAASQAVCGAVQAGCYAYVTIPANCDNGDNGGTNGDCTGYTLTATLESGGTYIKASLN